jgi:histone deacetylase HOS3
VHELSKLIIPSDRQTRSHAPEDLAPVRIKKDRLSAPVIVPAMPAVGGRQLRTRKPRGADTVSPPNEADMSIKPPPIDLARRQTISDLPMSHDVQSVPEKIQPPKRMTRRTSNMFEMKSEDTDVPPVPVMPAQLPPVSPKKARAKVLKPVPPKEPVMKQEPIIKTEPEPFFKLENRMARPEPKRYPSEPSVPTAMPPTVDYTKPINHIQPLRPAGIKRIHLKVGTREDHDRKMRELEEKAMAEAKSNFPRPDTAMPQQPVEQVTPQVENGVPQFDATISEPSTAPVMVEQQSSRRQPASASITVPSELTHRDSPLYLDVGPPTRESTPQQSAGAFTAPSQPQHVDHQQKTLRGDAALQAHAPQMQASQVQAPQTQASQLQAPPYHPAPQQQPNANFFNPSYTHPQNNLPSFSSTGAIPFAPTRPSGPTPVSGHGNGVSRSMLEGLPTLSKVITPDDVDMMDLDSPEKKRDGQNGRIIPETPQH